MAVGPELIRGFSVRGPSRGVGVGKTKLMMQKAEGTALLGFPGESELERLDPGPLSARSEDDFRPIFLPQSL